MSSLAFEQKQDYPFVMDVVVDPKLTENPVFLRVMRDALSIQDRFAAEPIYARTGKGYLKSTGVKEITDAKVPRHRRKS